MRVLSVTHGPSVPGGVFDDVVEAQGHLLERWIVPFGGRPPAPGHVDAIMVFGGAMHPDEDARHAWIPAEADFLREALDKSVPMIGVCLGAQLIARAAGAWVGPADQAEVGWLPVELTEAGRADPVLGVLPGRIEAFQWHLYTYAVPDGGVELAASPACTQAFRVGDAWGIQFHAEVTQAIIDAWIAEDGDQLPMPANELLAATTLRIGAWNDLGRALCSAFLEVAGGRGRTRVRSQATGPGSTGSESSRDHSCHEPA